MMQILFIKAKHGDRFLLISSQEVLHTFALDLVREHRRDGHYAGEPFHTEAVWTAHTTNDGALAWKLLQTRTYYEYEYVDLQEVDEP
jgi:hypothetical protein